MDGGRLQSVIERVTSNLERGRFPNETSVREAIVNPVLEQLGWDTLDPAMVVREFNLSGRRVDYALAIPPLGPTAIIEVKAVGLISGADRQLFEYAFHQGVPFAILTDGREWHFYLPGEQGDYAERRVYKLDLLERDPLQCVEMLMRYLGFDRVRDGTALVDARRDYRNAARQRAAAGAIPRAWREIVEERDEILMELIAEKAESLCGFKPDAEQVESFLAAGLTTLPSGDVPSAHPPRKVARSDSSNEHHTAGGRHVEPAAVEAHDESTSYRAASVGITYELNGQPFNARSAKDALLDILGKLSGGDPRFYERLAPLVAKRTRNHIASSPDQVYPNRPDLRGTVLEIAPGWWLGLNIANREKRSILMKACEVAGLRFGEQLRIDLPNAEQTRTPWPGR